MSSDSIRAPKISPDDDVDTMLGGLEKWFNEDLPEVSGGFGGSMLWIGLAICIIIILIVVFVIYAPSSSSAPQAGQNGAPSGPGPVMIAPQMSAPVATRRLCIGKRGDGPTTQYKFGINNDCNANGFVEIDSLGGFAEQESGTTPWCIGSAGDKSALWREQKCDGWGWKHAGNIYFPSGPDFQGTPTKPFSVSRDARYYYKVARGADGMPDARWNADIDGYSLE